MKLTSQDIHSIGTSGCGFNSAQLTLLGVTSLNKGWLRRLVGVEVSPETFELLKKLKGATPQQQLALVPNRQPVWKDQNRKHEPTRVSQIKDCKAQFKSLLACLQAEEYLAAEDHAQEIARICKRSLA
jgi:hypothetical protein